MGWIIHLAFAVFGLHLLTNQNDRVVRIIGAACFVTNFAGYVAIIVAQATP